MLLEGMETHGQEPWCNHGIKGYSLMVLRKFEINEKPCYVTSRKKVLTTVYHAGMDSALQKLESLAEHCAGSNLPLVVG